jgi:hypothetical protein
LIEQEAKRSGIKVSSKEIEAAVEEVKQRNKIGREELEKALAAEGLTLEAFKKELERGENPFRKTSSGKIEFYSPLLAKGPEYLATHDYFPEGSGICYGGGNLPSMAQWVPGGAGSRKSHRCHRHRLLVITQLRNPERRLAKEKVKFGMG